jgi:GNAT superfamily N-acetyltransferase
MSFQFRDFDYSESDYAQVIAIWNGEHPHNKTEIHEYRYQDKERNPDYFWQRVVAEMNGRVIGYGIYCETWWSARPGKYHLKFITHPDYRQQGIASAFYERVLEILTARGEVNLLTTDTYENKLDAIHFLHKRGFEQVMRFPVSHLDVPCFHGAAYSSLEMKMQQHGVRICSLAELMTTDPNWMQKLYDLEWEIEQDVPLPEPPTREPFAEYKKFVDSPNFLPEGYFVAVAGDDAYVGTSALWCSTADPTKMYTGLTGVTRSHRRQGIATAMKVRAIQYAQRQGVVIIETDNEENNPMYQLNLQLGFAPQPAELDFHNDMTEA